MKSPLVYVTRRSLLALMQSRMVIHQLLPHVQGGQAAFSELQVTTTGDRIQHVPLTEWGGKALFVKELEEALLQHRADFAIHSAKDLPAQLPSGLGIASVLKRGPTQDVLVAPSFSSLDQLPRGARVGTSSLRRAFSLRALRGDLDILPMRGNLETRFRKVVSGQYEAMVLAQAGVLRLGWGARITQVFTPEQMLPAVGQGVLAVECREEDQEVKALFSLIHDEETAICLFAERAVMHALGGGCKEPLAAYAHPFIEGGIQRLSLRAWVAHVDGSHYRSGEEQMLWPCDEKVAWEVGLCLGRRLSMNS
ncbi:hydroxymethylbilane synthase [Pajaroellobacter abortibovis]|uniref:Porphobilinogen deaminase n=1 Tax=Pajaroellobacter abortibovis TaxID=1882918 RepID=A0A1L6MVG0_9BACT|nr:hydroxymethylbilane synthase [Pajaroellobacter abortibovis]APR99395.1 hydroxymethylbilane synthase [Pajaroellobacter abortibovis]